MKQKITRQERGLGLFRSGAIVKKTDDGYLVTGSNGNEYEVRCDYDQWTCDCKDSQFRGHGGSATDLCKHAYLVKYWLETLKKQITATEGTEVTNVVNTCRTCLNTHRLG